MSIEAALVVGVDYEPLFWHLPQQRSAVHLPDSRDLWTVIWENRANLLGIAHTHPGSGPTSPSHEDVTTFDAVEKALDKRLCWWILTSDFIGLWMRSPLLGRFTRYDMGPEPIWAYRLRELSQYKT